jgi:hypothetical protein
MVVINRKFSWLVLTGFCLSWVAVGSGAQPAQKTADSMDYRAFLQSLTPAEQKLPRPLVFTQRFAEGKPLPSALQSRFAARRNPWSQRSVYRIDGTNAWQLVVSLEQLGATPVFVSQSRHYVTASLSQSDAARLAEYPSVSRISQVTGPTAQGQGSTQAAAAHRLSDLYPVGKPDAGDPSLNGSGVVIGLVSLPFKQADFDRLAARNSPRVIPAGVKILEGAVDNTNGSLDALYLLQLIYDMAPNAQVIMASPGVNSVPGQMAEQVADLVSGESNAGVPANIIIDDLFYLDQNPFEIDEVGEAITAAREANILYISAAGDHGHDGEASTSAVYLADFDPIKAPTSLVAIDPFLEGLNVQSFGEDGQIIVREDLSNLCIFWSEKPLPGTLPRFTAWVYDDSDKLILGAELFTSAPGGCTGVPVSSGSKVVVDFGYDSAKSNRLMVTGARSEIPAQLDLSTAMFDDVTSGSIRGHAANTDALTVAASDLCVDGPSTNYASCSALSISAFSADGESATTPRFFWESDGNGGYSAIAGGRAVAKPDISAAGQSGLINGASDVEAAVYGTSVSAAVTAGISALYWQYANEHLGIRAEFMDEVVRYLLSRSALELAAPLTSGTAGVGIIDAPKPFQDGLGTPSLTRPFVKVSLDAKAAGALLQFRAALPSDQGATYALTCTESGSALTDWTDKAVVPDTTYVIQAAPSSELKCTVTGSVSDAAGTTETAQDVATVTVAAVTETQVFYDYQIDALSVSWVTDSNIVAPDMLTVFLRCVNTATQDVVVNEQLTASPYELVSEEGNEFECSVTTTLTVKGVSSQLGAPVTETLEPAQAGGLPIWLLYQVTRPAEEP